MQWKSEKDEVGLPQKTAGEYNCTADTVRGDSGVCKAFFFSLAISVP
jgi:hypothetical protein